MSSAPLPFNPYRPPDEVLAEPARRGGRPGMLTTICVLAMVLGALGMCTGLMGVAGLFGGKQLQQMFQPQKQPGMNDEMFQVQQDMQKEINAISDQYFVPNLIMLLVHFTVASSLIVGGLMTLYLKPMGRTILISACVLALCFEGGRTTLNVMIQLKTLAIMETYMQKMISAGPQGPNAKQAEQVVKTAMKVGMVIGFVFAGAIVLVKVVYYVLSLIYLSRSNVKALFVANAALADPYAPRI